MLSNSLLSKLILALGIYLYSDYSNADPNMNIPDSPGIHDVRMTTSLGDVDVTLSIPESLEERVIPLVLVLHYAGEPSAFYGRPLLEYLVLPSFETFPAMMLAPTSLGGDWKQPHNIKAIFELIETLEQQFKLDTKRRVVTGYSMGAIGSWHIASEYPDFFSAALPVAGFPMPITKCHLPTHAILSSDDEIFPLEKFTQSVAQGSDPNLHYTVIHGAGHYDISAFAPALQKAVTEMVQTLDARK